MQEKIEKVCTAVLERITPRKREQAKIKALAEELGEKVISASRKSGIEAEVRVEGSVAKDTWISEGPDVDIFILMSSSIPYLALGEICLKIAREATEGSKQIERFAEHPYLEAIVEGTRVNIVPCYRVERGEWLSATDRTPFHTDYVKEHLKDQMKSEVRLLKKFMKGIGVYGAEIKVGGFSGYLCELLILKNKSFINTLKAFAQFDRALIIDIEKYYKEGENELRLLFKDPLVMVDPVDRKRNVASAVQPQKLYTFIAAARTFLENPDTKFFYTPETVALPAKEMRQELAKRGSAIIFLTFEKVDVVPDILWGQLYKSQRSLHKQIQSNDFIVLRSITWSDEKTVNMFLFELEQRFLSSIKKHSGPPLEKRNACKNFILKHTHSLDTVSGPYIEDGRWIVEISRRYTDCVVLLKEKLRDGGRNVGVAKKISEEFRKGFSIFVNEEIMEIYRENSDFARFLTEFLSGKPRWLEKS